MAGGYRALDPPVNEDDTVSHLPPIESMNTRHRREIAEQERRFEIKRREERRREARERREVSSNRRIESLEEQVHEVVRCMITACEGLENELRRVTAENNELRAKQAPTRNRVGRTAFGAGRARRQGHRPPIAVGALRTNHGSHFDGPNASP